MALLKSTQTNSNLPILTGDRASDTITLFGDYTLTGSEANADVIEMLPLPAGYVVVDGYVDTQDCGTTLTIDAGFVSGEYRATGARTCGAEFLNDKAFGTAGVYRFDVVGFSRQAPSTTNRGIGLKVDAAVSALTAGQVIRMVVLARPAIEGV